MDLNQDIIVEEEEQQGTNDQGETPDFSSEDTMESYETENTEGKPDQTPALPRVKVEAMPKSVKDPMIKGLVFVVKGWAYRVYDERSKGRKFIARVGKVVEDGS